MQCVSPGAAQVPARHVGFATFGRESIMGLMEYCETCEADYPGDTFRTKDGVRWHILSEHEVHLARPDGGPLPSGFPDFAMDSGQGNADDDNGD
jgi:hypothetical protein